MTRHAALFVTVGFLFISGCATTAAHRSTPVALTVTSDTVNNVFVQFLRDATLDVIRKQVPNAHPMAINVKLEVTSRFEETPRILFSNGYVGADNSSFTFQNQKQEQVTAYRVVYTISDAAGRVVESNQLALDDGHYLVDAKAGTPLKERYGLVGDTAVFLASRVKTLDQ